jgi:hypothetical protein
MGAHFRGKRRRRDIKGGLSHGVLRIQTGPSVQQGEADRAVIKHARLVGGWGERCEHVSRSSWNVAWPSRSADQVQNRLALPVRVHREAGRGAEDVRDRAGVTRLHRVTQTLA